MKNMNIAISKIEFGEYQSRKSSQKGERQVLLAGL
jgi:hypothetical protein